MKEKLHAIVIGSGPLGAIAARRLAENGLKVSLIESGKSITTPPGNHFRNASHFQSSPDAFFPEIMPHFSFFDRDACEEGLPGASTTSVFGGQGLFWTNNSPRATGAELWNLPSGLSWDDHYEIAERYLAVSNDEFSDSIRGQKIQTRLQKVGREAVSQPFSGWRKADGTTHFVATSDILSPINERAIEHLNGQVEKLILRDGKATGVWINGNEMEADVIFLAGGTIGTTRLLFQSGIESAALGKYLSYHPVLISQLVLADDLRAPSDVTDSPPRIQIPPTLDRPWNTMVLRDSYPIPPRDDDADIPENSLTEIQNFCPIENRKTNRMVLTDSTTTFDVPFSSSDREKMAAILDDAQEVATALGRFRRGCEPIWLDLGFAHLMGSCRIGEDPADSVTDGFGRPHGLANIYVNSLAAIPTPMAVNPTLTAAAMTVVSVDHYLHSLT